MSKPPLVIVALSGGVDSAVAALLLREQGYCVQCLHMTNWEDDGYCTAAADYQDARKVAKELGLPLHRVNFSDAYRQQVFARFLADYEAGRTPNPDVLCNREIKFGALWRYAQRLGAELLATGHYARLERSDGQTALLKGADPAKDQSYFLHAVDAATLEHVLFPLGGMTKHEVRQRARAAGLATAAKKDSTGICFIGERPFREFLSRYLRSAPGPIEAPDGRVVGEHRGLAFYTIGQRHGLDIGGVRDYEAAPWYVAGKDAARNVLRVVQGTEHPLLRQNWLAADNVHWIDASPPGWNRGAVLRCRAKTRYRQPDQACAVVRTGADALEVTFETAQRAVTPGQYVVFYQGDRCLGGATIAAAQLRDPRLEAAS